MSHGCFCAGRLAGNTFSWQRSRPAQCRPCLFRLLQGMERACVAPFLTLYLQHLVLPALLVSTVAGDHLAAVLCAPLCSHCPKSHRKRRLLVAGSLLGSAGADLLLTLIPPADGDVGYTRCNASQQPDDRGAAAMVPGQGSRGVLSMSATMNAKGAWKETVKTTGDVLLASRMPATSASFQGLFAEKKGRGIGEGNAKVNGYSAGPSGSTTSVKAVNWETGEPGMLALYRPPLHRLKKEMSSLGSAARDLAVGTEESLRTERNEMSLFKTTLLTVGGADMPGKVSDHWKDAQDASAAKNLFQDREHQIFRGTVVLWELLATTFERTVDESLHEYLDFVDATDYGKLWIWSYLGT
ncbi:LOW QUALITY PROTEIN: major facilitator superfamily domain-containing protein 6-like [Rhynochetos jubatus]